MLNTKENIPFTKVPVECLRDKRLSLKAKGLYSYICSCAPTWECSISGFATVLKESRGAIGKAAQELEKYGYLTRTYHRDKDGKFDDVTYIAEAVPVTKDSPTCTLPM